MAEEFYKSPLLADYLETQRTKLPLLSEVSEDLSDKVVRFLGCNPGRMQLQGTNTYLVGNGSSRILIDTGEGNPQWARNLIGYLEDHDIRICDVLITHGHDDHTGGIADLLAHDHNVRVWKNSPEPGQLAITHNQIFQTEGATLKAILTPGHSFDHVCLLLEDENALFTGDNVLGHGYSVAEDLNAYISSLRVMEGLNCTRGYPGHGSILNNLPQTIARYIAQRVSREKQIYRVLASRASSSSPFRDSGRANGCEAGDSGMGTLQGLSTADIGSLMYGEVSQDSANFSSAVCPLLNQVLHTLLERGKVNFRLAGPDHTRQWFATI